MNTEIKTQVVVLGGGPAGYSAAFRCADLGLDTILVERYSTLGGVCLNVGCIPSKALLHIVKVIKENKEFNKKDFFSIKLQIDLFKIRAWKDQIIKRLSAGLINMAKMRKIKIINGYGKFITTHSLLIENKNNVIITFEQAVIATGSEPIKLPFFSSYNHSCIWNSTDALALNDIPKHLLIIGGGIIGLEIATIYHTLGSEIDIIETLDQVIPVVDKDIIEIFTKNIKSYFNIMLETKVTGIKVENNSVYVDFSSLKKTLNKTKCYDAVLIAIGRSPNSNFLGIEKIGININKQGFIVVDKQMKTNISHIYAIGDVIGQPMLAHKGIYEGRIAAENIFGKKYFFDSKVIPSIAYTDPEVSWVGITEKIAKEKGIDYAVSVFPWSALGRAFTLNSQEGITKLIFDKKSNRLIGGAIVGINSGELLGELSLAIEMGCEAEDIALTIHAHPTLYESIGLAAEIHEGTITELFNINTK